MRKASLWLVVVAAMAALALTAAAGPKGPQGPAEKATGTAYLEVVSGPDNQGPDGQTRYTQLNAHEAVGNRPAKGELYWYQTLATGSVAEFYVDIDTVEVDGDTATFEGVCVDGTSRIGQRLYGRVVDNGEPGIWADELWLRWETQAAAGWTYVVSEGNLQVHSYGD